MALNVCRQSMFILAFVFALAPPAMISQGSTHSCGAEQYRQLDFWLGDWTVRNPSGGIEGTNSVTKEHQGCVIIEHWQSPDQTGISLNFYDYRVHKWRQEWVDSFGNTLSLSGGVVNGRMTLSGDRLTTDGRVAMERNVWFTDASGRLRNVWDYSLDRGKTWIIRFDGIYERK